MIANLTDDFLLLSEVVEEGDSKFVENKCVSENNDRKNSELVLPPTIESDSNKSLSIAGFDDIDELFRDISLPSYEKTASDKMTKFEDTHLSDLDNFFADAEQHAHKTNDKPVFKDETDKFGSDFLQVHELAPEEKEISIENDFDLQNDVFFSKSEDFNQISEPHNGKSENLDLTAENYFMEIPVNKFTYNNEGVANTLDKIENKNENLEDVKLGSVPDSLLEDDKIQILHEKYENSLVYAELGEDKLDFNLGADSGLDVSFFEEKKESSAQDKTGVIETTNNLDKHIFDGKDLFENKRQNSVENFILEDFRGQQVSLSDSNIMEVDREHSHVSNVISEDTELISERTFISDKVDDNAVSAVDEDELFMHNLVGTSTANLFSPTSLLKEEVVQPSINLSSAPTTDSFVKQNLGNSFDTNDTNPDEISKIKSQLFELKRAVAEITERFGLLPVQEKLDVIATQMASTKEFVSKLEQTVEFIKNGFGEEIHAKPTVQNLAEYVSKDDFCASQLNITQSLAQYATKEGLNFSKLEITKDLENYVRKEYLDTRLEKMRIEALAQIETTMPSLIAKIIRQEIVKLTESMIK